MGPRALDPLGLPLLLPVPLFNGVLSRSGVNLCMSGLRPAVDEFLEGVGLLPSSTTKMPSLLSSS